MNPYEVALLDWLACACAGAGERAAVAVRAGGGGLLDDVAVAGTAGHVLDFDDTFSGGVAHVTAPTAPAALVLAAHVGLSLGDALEAFAAGWEAMAAVAQASHPALYDAGWHPTAVCGPIGAATAAARLLGLSADQRQHALGLAVLRAGGTRGAFGSDGKAIQVGLAAAAGVQAALMAQAGGVVDSRAIEGFENVLGASWAQPAEPPAIERNWIKRHPSCLGTHSPIDAAEQAPHHLPLEVHVHPVARQAAYLDDVTTGLEGKFSIPYCVALTMVAGPPGVRDFAALDPEAAARSRQVRVVLDEALPEFGVVLATQGQELARLSGPSGSPERPLTDEQLRRKVEDLAGDRLLGVFDDLSVPARTILERVRLS